MARKAPQEGSRLAAKFFSRRSSLFSTDLPHLLGNKNRNATLSDSFVWSALMPREK